MGHVSNWNTSKHVTPHVTQNVTAGTKKQNLLEKTHQMEDSWDMTGNSVYLVILRASMKLGESLLLFRMGE